MDALPEAREFQIQRVVKGDIERGNVTFEPCEMKESDCVCRRTQVSSSVRETGFS